MSGTQNHIGKTSFVAVGLPATNDAAGFEALTWIEIGGGQQLPQLGVSHGNIDAPDLKSGFTKGIKSSASGNDSQITCRDLGTPALDPGQQILSDLSQDSDGFGSVKIVKGSGAGAAVVEGDPVQYAQGYFHSFLEMTPNDQTHEGFTCSFRQNEKTVKDVEPS